MIVKTKQHSKMGCFRGAIQLISILVITYFCVSVASYYKGGETRQQAAMFIDLTSAQHSSPSFLSSSLGLRPYYCPRCIAFTHLQSRPSSPLPSYPGRVCLVTLGPPGQWRRNDGILMVSLGSLDGWVQGLIWRGTRSWKDDGIGWHELLRGEFKERERSGTRRTEES